MPHARSAALVGAALAALALPAAADARGSITYDGSTMTFTGDGAPDHVGIGVSQGELSWTSSGLDAIPAQCTRPQYVDHTAYCPFPQKIVVRLGGGDDTFAVSEKAWDPISSNVVIESFGDEGADWLQSGDSQDGGPGNDKLEGHEGDQVLRGGPGDDLVSGLAGNDQVFGEDGSDTVSGDGFKAPGRDVIDGGQGEDVIENDWTESQKPSLPVTLTQNGVADDGRSGEGDDVRSVERFKIFSGGTFTGTDGADTFEVEAAQGRGLATISGLGGDDRIVGDDGEEAIDGGAGNDYLEGGWANDTLVGGPGRDTIFADDTGAHCNYATFCVLPYGNDTVDARDGEADTVDCGIGTDSVKADAIDVLNGCETVDVAPGGGSAPGPAADGPAKGRALSVAVGGGRLGAALRSGLVVRATVPGPGRVAVTVKRGGRTVARGSARAAAAGTRAVRARFTAGGRRALGRVRRARLVVEVRFTPRSGAARSARHAVTLRR